MEKKKEEDDEVQFGPQGNITVKNCFFLIFFIEKVYLKTVQSLSNGNRNWNSVYQNSIVTIQTKIYVEFLTQFQTLAKAKKGPIRKFVNYK